MKNTEDSPSALSAPSRLKFFSSFSDIAYHHFQLFHLLPPGWYAVEDDVIPTRCFHVVYNKKQYSVTLSCYFMAPLETLELPTHRPILYIETQGSVFQERRYLNWFRQKLTPMDEALDMYFFPHHGYIGINWNRCVLRWIDGKHYTFRINQDMWVCMTKWNPHCFLCEPMHFTIKQGTWFHITVCKNRSLFVRHQYNQYKAKQLQPFVFQEPFNFQSKQFWKYEENPAPIMRYGSQLTFRMQNLAGKEINVVTHYNKFLKHQDCILESQLTCVGAPFKQEDLKISPPLYYEK